MDRMYTHLKHKSLAAAIGEAVDSFTRKMDYPPTRIIMRRDEYTDIAFGMPIQFHDYIQPGHFMLGPVVKREPIVMMTVERIPV